MTRWAGWIVTLAGLGHTLGSLAESAPRHIGSWLDRSLWSETEYSSQSDAAAAFWYSMFSFGPPMLLLGTLLLWLDRRGLEPPPFVSWALAIWVIATFVMAGPSPLPVLLVAVGLLWRAARAGAHPGSPPS